MPYTGSGNMNVPLWQIQATMSHKLILKCQRSFQYSIPPFHSSGTVHWFITAGADAPWLCWENCIHYTPGTLWVQCDAVWAPKRPFSLPTSNAESLGWSQPREWTWLCFSVSRWSSGVLWDVWWTCPSSGIGHQPTAEGRVEVETLEVPFYLQAGAVFRTPDHTQWNFAKPWAHRCCEVLLNTSVSQGGQTIFGVSILPYIGGLLKDSRISPNHSTTWHGRFSWNAECEGAFKTLKEKLVEPRESLQRIPLWSRCDGIHWSFSCQGSVGNTQS